MIKIVYSEGLCAQAIMDLDKELLDSLEEESLPILHFYSWRAPSVTHGYFIDPKNYLNMENIAKLKIELAKRPTGGGIVFHLWDLAFSFLLPSSHDKFFSSTLDNYFFVNSVVLQTIKDFLSLEERPLLRETRPIEEYGLKGEKKLQDERITLEKSDCGKMAIYEKEELKERKDKVRGGSVPSIFSGNAFFEKERNESNFCMAGPTKYDVVLDGKKVAGAAQRRTKRGYLHQGTIALSKPDEVIMKKSILDLNTITLMRIKTFPLIKSGEKISDFQIDRLKTLLIKHFEKSLC